MSQILNFLGRVLAITAGIVLEQVCHHYWGWSGVIALGAVIVAIYFAADAHLERTKRR